ncbi:energy transducer TonB [Mucilaginibacter sp. 22184]|uniref:energy transducer TonB n=1 Tax=Mucilaginibacter sp. 22184 TaxID=3453887 RepID=UPI003F85C5B2
MKSIIIFYLLCFAFVDAFAQNSENTCEGKQDSILHKFVYTKVDEAPEPVDGFLKINEVITKNLKLPPSTNYYGLTIIVFVVEADGQIDGQRVKRDPSGDEHLLGNQILRNIATLKWKPGKCNGKPVPCMYSIPINLDPSLSE